MVSNVSNIQQDQYQINQKSLKDCPFFSHKMHCYQVQGRIYFQFFLELLFLSQDQDNLFPDPPDLVVLNLTIIYMFFHNLIIFSIINNYKSACIIINYSNKQQVNNHNNIQQTSITDPTRYQSSLIKVENRGNQQKMIRNKYNINTNSNESDIHNRNIHGNMGSQRNPIDTQNDQNRNSINDSYASGKWGNNQEGSMVQSARIGNEGRKQRDVQKLGSNFKFKCEEQASQEETRNYSKTKSKFKDNFPSFSYRKMYINQVQKVEQQGQREKVLVNKINFMLYECQVKNRNSLNLNEKYDKTSNRQIFQSIINKDNKNCIKYKSSASESQQILLSSRNNKKQASYNQKQKQKQNVMARHKKNGNVDVQSGEGQKSQALKQSQKSNKFTLRNYINFNSMESYNECQDNLVSETSRVNSEVVSHQAKGNNQLKESIKRLKQQQQQNQMKKSNQIKLKYEQFSMGELSQLFSSKCQQQNVSNNFAPPYSSPSCQSNSIKNSELKRNQKTNTNTNNNSGIISYLNENLNRNSLAKTDADKCWKKVQGNMQKEMLKQVKEIKVMFKRLLEIAEGKQKEKMDKIKITNSLRSSSNSKSRQSQSQMQSRQVDQQQSKVVKQYEYSQ